MAKLFKHNAQPQKSPGFTVVIFKGVFISLLVSFLWILLLAFISLSSESLLVENYIRYLMVAATMISIFIGGIYAAKRTKSAGLLVGMAVGLVYVLISIAIGMIISSEPLTVLAVANKLFAGLAAGALGGLVGVNL